MPRTRPTTKTHTAPVLPTPPPPVTIYITKLTFPILDPSSASAGAPAPDLGYGEIYELRLNARAGSPAGRGNHLPLNTPITWTCDQAFTLFAPDQSHWAPGPGSTWTPLPLWDNGSASSAAYPQFDALNSTPTPPAHGPYSLTLTVRGAVGDVREYAILIPQIDLLHVHFSSAAGTRTGGKRRLVPPGNALVRATVILQ